jgi:hypothetical protein
MRLPPVLLLVLTVACGKPFWHPPLPALSQEPLPLGQAVTWGIYATLLAEEGGSPENHPVRNPVILAESTLASEPGSFESFDYGIGGKAFIGSRWPDSVKVGFSAAFADLWHKARRRHPIDPSVVLGLAVQLGDTGSRPCGVGSAPWCQERATHVALSPIGFNGDSTYAVVYRTMWCGPTCGTGVLFMFRRTASTAWTVWDAHLMWIS